MKIKHIELPEYLNEAWLVNVSDVHIGEAKFDEKTFYHYLDWIKKTDNCYVILNGDILNMAIKDSVSNVYEDVLSPEEQLKAAINIFEPVKEKILAVVNGNHDNDRVYKNVGLNVLEWLSKELDVYYAGDECYLKVTLGRNSHGKRIAYNVYATHGWSSSRTKGAKINSLDQLSRIVLADLYFISHSHLPATFKDCYFVPDNYNNNIIEKELTYVNTCGFLLRSPYAVRKGLPPASRSLPRARLDGKEKRIEVTL